MNVSIDKAIEWKLDMNASSIYACILKRDYETFNKLKEIIKPGWFSQYLERLDEMELIQLPEFKDFGISIADIKLPEKPKKRISKKNVESGSFDEFVLEYYNCFPSDAYTGDFKVKSGLSQCKTKLKTFMSQHKNYSRELILQATRLYCENKKREGYTFMKLAPYFIAKEGQPSLLETMCESLLKGENLITNNIGNTESI